MFDVSDWVQHSSETESFLRLQDGFSMHREADHDSNLGISIILQIASVNSSKNAKTSLIEEERLSVREWCYSVPKIGFTYLKFGNGFRSPISKFVRIAP